MSVASEGDSLLRSAATSYSEDTGVFKRFSSARKNTIVLCVTVSSLVSLFPAGTFIPAIPQIVQDLHSTPDVVSLAVGTFIVTAAIGNLFWACYSTYYGRRPVYIAATLLLAIGSLGVATANSVYALLAWRAVQAFGASAEIIGPGAIGDVYGVTRRGAVVGFYMGAMQIGPMLSPIVGGLMAHYYSWRTMQVAIAICASILLVLLVTVFPETVRPGERGVDKAQEEGAGKGWVWLNPFASFALLRDPALLAVALAGTCVQFSGYVITVPLPYTVGERYGIANEALIGAFFLPAGLGNMIGAPLAGRLSDIAIRRARRKHSSVPEDRLHASIFPAGALVPGATLVFGFAVGFVPGAVGIVLAALALFLHGLGANMVLSPVIAFGVDVVGDHSAEVTAANAGLRAFLIALASPGVMPLLEHMGVAFANTVAALVAWLGFGLLVCTIRYGGRLRSWMNSGSGEP